MVLRVNSTKELVEPANNVRYARIQDSLKGNEIVGMRVPEDGLCS